MTKISVIIPVYNAEKYISRCLDCIINQSFQDFEIICIDDKSKDGSEKILEEYSKKDKRIKIINNDKNLGSALTRNKGIDAAIGEYIYFIDADDYIDGNYLENMFEKAELSGCDIVLNYSIQSESNTISQYTHPTMPEVKPEGIYIDGITATHDAPCFLWARLYRKSFLDRYNLRFLNINATEDVVFNCITNMFCDKTYVFYGEKYHYTVNTSSITGTAKSDNVRDLLHIKAHSMIYDYLKEHDKLDTRLKLFRVYPFIKVDNEEKFKFYKNFFEKIEQDFHKNENIYNDMEKYFAYSLLNSANYEEYLKNYNKVVTIGFIRHGKINI